MHVMNSANQMVKNLHLVVDDALNLSEFHICPKKASRLKFISERAMHLADEIEEEYDL